MSDYGRRIVVDQTFDAVLSEASRLIREEGLQPIARVDVRDHFWRDLRHDFRLYFIVQVWSPELALESLLRNLDIGTVLATTFAMYELADGETCVVVRDPFSSMAADPEWRRNNPELAAIADRESDKIGRVLSRLQERPANHGSVSPAA